MTCQTKVILKRIDFLQGNQVFNIGGILAYVDYIKNED